MTVRTRFAPSPTGYMHIGGMRTALFNWLWARHNGGQFILRIDDTDQQRNMDEALGPILRAFKWLGLTWDEGPEIRSIRAADFRSFVPRQAEPLECSQDRAERLVHVALLVGVVDPQNELPAVVPSPQPIEQRGAHPTDVHVARRAGSKSRSDSHLQSSQSSNAGRG